jgi:hypothetical protein
MADHRFHIQFVLEEVGLFELAVHESADFLKCNDVGIDLAQDRQYPFRVIPPVAADT